MGFVGDVVAAKTATVAESVKNKDVFKTREEADKAFDGICTVAKNGTKICRSCRYWKYRGRCITAWMFDESSQSRTETDGF